MRQRKSLISAHNSYCELDQYWCTQIDFLLFFTSFQRFLWCDIIDRKRIEQPLYVLYLSYCILRFTFFLSHIRGFFFIYHSFFVLTNDLYRTVVLKNGGFLSTFLFVTLLINIWVWRRIVSRSSSILKSKNSTTK